MSLYDPPNRPRTIDTDTYLELVKARANAFLARITWGWSKCYHETIGSRIEAEFEPITGGTGEYTEHIVMLNFHLRDHHDARVYDEESGESEWLESEVWSPDFDLVLSWHQLYLDGMEEISRTDPEKARALEKRILQQKRKMIAKWASESGTRVKRVNYEQSQGTT